MAIYRSLERLSTKMLAPQNPTKLFYILILGKKFWILVKIPGVSNPEKKRNFSREFTRDVNVFTFVVTVAVLTLLIGVTKNVNVSIRKVLVRVTSH